MFKVHITEIKPIKDMPKNFKKIPNIRVNDQYPPLCHTHPYKVELRMKNVPPN